MSYVAQVLIGLVLVVPAVVLVRRLLIEVSAVRSAETIRAKMLEMLAMLVEDKAVPQHVKQFSKHLAIMSVNDGALRQILHADAPHGAGRSKQEELVKAAGRHGQALQLSICAVAMMALAHDPVRGKSMRRALHKMNAENRIAPPRALKSEAKKMAIVVTDSIENEMLVA